jgi:ParB family chromosome partitioning protein
MLKVVPLSSIKIGKSFTDADHVKALAHSMIEVGVLEPVLVNEDYAVLGGFHRCRAAKLAELDKVPVHVIDADEIGQRIAAIDSNLHLERPALERAEALAERKKLYEGLHPQAKQGGAPGKKGGGKAKTAKIASFASDVAAKAKKSARSVRQYVEVAEKLAPKAKKKLKGTEAANSITDLQRLAKLEPEHQVAVAERVAETGESVKQAAKALNREKQVEQARVYQPPPGEFEVITVDFPWKYDDKLDGKGMERGLPLPADDDRGDLRLHRREAQAGEGLRAVLLGDEPDPARHARVAGGAGEARAALGFRREAGAHLGQDERRGRAGDEAGLGVAQRHRAPGAARAGYADLHADGREPREPDSAHQLPGTDRGAQRKAGGGLHGHRAHLRQHEPAGDVRTGAAAGVGDDGERAAGAAAVGEDIGAAARRGAARRRRHRPEEAEAAADHRRAA